MAKNNVQFDIRHPQPPFGGREGGKEGRKEGRKEERKRKERKTENN